jgi:hypothetical protein
MLGSSNKLTDSWKKVVKFANFQANLVKLQSIWSINFDLLSFWVFDNLSSNFAQISKINSMKTLKKSFPEDQVKGTWVQAVMGPFGRFGYKNPN